MGNHQGKSIKLGGYHLHFVKQIAEGGFSYVFLVRDSNTSKHYALKRILVRDDLELNKVLTEINIMKQLKNHRNIVKFIDYHKTATNDKNGSSEIFILMEFCSGGHLVEIMQKRQTNRMTQMEVLKIFQEVCEAVGHMHSQTPLMIHRDLKVENVLLDEESGVYKLCDFGSATTEIKYIRGKADIHLAEEDIQKNTTLQYRAPEIVDFYRCNVINEKIDIWALGCLLYKLMFYTTPFEDAGSLGILNCNYQLPPPGSPSYSVEMLTLVKVILNPDPLQRPSVFEIANQVSLLRGASLVPYPNYKSNILSNKPIPKPLPQVPQPQQQKSLPVQPNTVEPLPTNNIATPPINGGENGSFSNGPSPNVPRLNGLTQQVIQQQQQQSQSQPVTPHSPKFHRNRRNPSQSHSNNITPSLISAQSTHKNDNPFSLDDGFSNQSNIPTNNVELTVSEYEELNTLVNNLINNNENLSFDSNSVSKLKGYTKYYKPGKGIMGLIIKKPLREPLICFKSLLLVQLLLKEGNLTFKSDVYDNKDLFSNLHLGWAKQNDKLGEFLSNYSFLIYKLILFYSRYPMIDGGFSYNELKWGLPDSYEGGGPISLITVKFLSEIIDQIFLSTNSVIDLSNQSSSNNSSGLSPTSNSISTLVLPLPLLTYYVNISNSISYSIYCFISGSLESLSKLNLPDNDLRFFNSVSNFQSIHQSLREQYSKLYTNSIFSDQFFPTLPNTTPQFNIPSASDNPFGNNISNDPFATNSNNDPFGGSMEPSFNPFQPNNNNNDNFFENPPSLRGSSSSINSNAPPPHLNTLSPPMRSKGVPLRFPHSASLEDARLYHYILTPSASPPLSPSLGRLGHSHSTIQTFDINHQLPPGAVQQPQPPQQQPVTQHVHPSGLPKFQFPQPQSGPNSLNNSFSNLFITPPTSLNSSHNPFENPNLPTVSVNSGVNGSTPGAPPPPTTTTTSTAATPNNPQMKSNLQSLKLPGSSRGHRRSQSSTTDDVRRRNLLQQQLDQNREFQKHQRLVNMKNQQEDLLNELETNGSFMGNDEEESSLL